MKTAFSTILTQTVAELIAAVVFDGRAHDGLVDARNTANLYRQSRDEQMFKKLKSMISEQENPLVFSMSDVFNFDNLKRKED